MGVIKTNDIEIKWQAIGKSCLWMFLAFGAGFFILALLKRIPGYMPLVEGSPWIPKYIGDSVAFAVGMFIIWKISRGRLKDYGFSLASKNLKIKLSLVLGIFVGLLGILLNHFPELISGVQFKPAHPSLLTSVNILGMMTFQWIFVGIFEETITRGLVQTYLMKKLKGIVTLYKWDFHIGSIITAIIFGVGHFGPHMFFGGSWLTLVPHLLFATAYGLFSSYIYQETRSLVGPILMHNVVDGLLHSVDYLFY
ncbi:MAG: CPBP family intramembrane glutamic endopeptidase [Thermodesulfobacteriota bacterium]